ncbi:MAG: tRNA uridine-5-carboxymethylaminomethyl(34) synthesis GTPase MnmE [Desulfobacterota bacterium]|nr:tRNA uridine-5-carboxymethylaminomethyl(34) synthesis GTPase MnmE [Thermodesulfobacteriota bacterium]
MYDSDTIAAIATPPGSSAIGIIRISGPESLRIAASLFRSPSFSPETIRSHHLYHGRIVDPHDGCTLDEVLVSYMRAPTSYTGEDVVEINMHGGMLVLQKTLELVCAAGARIARPGEFTRRAFCNGRMDLAQAEAVMDIINAQTEIGLKLASRLLTGELSHTINLLMDDVIDITAHLEAAIDFPEDDIQPQDAHALAQRISGILESLRRLQATSTQGTMIRTGIQAVIAGKPNVGKSSILNALLGHYRAIVTPEPGTTRDIIQETINISGVPVHLVDTAGIRESHHAVEQIGIDMTRARIQHADIVILVLDGSIPLDEFDRSIMHMLQGKHVLVAVNKSDLPRAYADDAVASLMPHAPVIHVSALMQQGIDAMRDALAAMLLHDTPINVSEIMVAHVRHGHALLQAAEALEHARQGLQAKQAPELIAVDLQSALAHLGEITGRSASEDILDTIFESFCIGK